MTRAFSTICISIGALIAASPALAELNIANLIELSEDSVDSSFVFTVSIPGEYDQTNTVILRLTEGLTQVDIDSGAFDTAFNWINSGLWGGSLEVSDPSVNPSTQYCYKLTGTLSWSGNFPFSMDDEGCVATPPPPTPPTTALLWFNDCIFNVHSFTATWDSTNLNPGDYFEVEYMSGGGWNAWFEGAASCNPINTYFPELTVRIRVVDILGQVSGWIIIFAQGNCGGDPF